MTDRILNRMWSQSINQMRSNIIKVKCLSPTPLYFRDINRTFKSGVEENITAGEFHSSKELQNAIQKRILVVTGRENEVIKNIKNTIQPQQTIDKDLLRDMVKEVASEMVSQILNQLPQTIVQQVTVDKNITNNIQNIVENKLQSVDIEEDTFVKMQNSNLDEESINTNLSAQAESKSMATEQVLSSLARIKAMKKKEKGITDEA
jgi:hypothetical protein